MLSHALSASFADRAEQRVADRRVLRLQAQIATPEGAGGVQVHNLSKTGMLVEASGPVTVGETIEVDLPGGTTHRAEIVWADDALFGCHFAKPLSQAVLSAALLRADPQGSDKKALSAPTHRDALAKLDNTWARDLVAATDEESEKLPVGVRFLAISGLALIGWAVPAAAAYLLW